MIYTKIRLSISDPDLHKCCICKKDEYLKNLSEILTFWSLLEDKDLSEKEKIIIYEDIA